MAELITFLPCPFCLSEDVVLLGVDQTEADKWSASIRCEGCDVVVSSAYSSDFPNEAIRAVAARWNIREEAE